MKYDFSGYATKNDLQCSDGRIIRQGAFRDCDGKTVPLVWQHRHDGINNVLGHALLEERDDGMYAYCTTNDTPEGKKAKAIVEHGDVDALSIFANRLQQRGSDVVHGVIREVSLVLAGANHGAKIDNLQFAHSDGTIEDLEDEAVIYTGTPISHSIPFATDSSAGKPDLMEIDIDTDTDADSEEEISHEDQDSEKEEKPEETVGDVIDGLSDEQKEVVESIVNAVVNGGKPADNAEEVINGLSEKQQTAVFALIGSIVEAGEEDSSDEEDKEASHSDSEGDPMKFNVFDNESNDTTVLTHDDIETVFREAKSSGSGSLKEACLAHGITDIEVLFPEAQTLTNQPSMISRRMEWVDSVLSACRKSPFSRVKSITANITRDEARAKGYIKGTKKIEEQIVVLKRKTDPQTIYKLQKLDRDDIIDITDFDVVVFMKNEMRMMLNEELARAILVGDGRLPDAQDKIDEEHIRPVWTDDEMYTVHTVVDGTLTGSNKAKAFIEACIRSRKLYKGSGTPTLYVGQDLLTEMRLLRDTQGYRLYKNDQELADELRVSKIVEVELFDGLHRTVNDDDRVLGGLIVNLGDYNLGANRGGEVTLFDDFDLNYNKYEYLIETRCSGALVVPYSAMAIEFGDPTTVTTELGNGGTGSPELGETGETGTSD